MVAENSVCEGAAELHEEHDQQASFLSARLDGSQVRLCLGFAAFISWINLLFCFEGLLRDVVAYGGGVVHDPFFSAAAATASVLLLVQAARTRSANSVVHPISGLADEASAAWRARLVGVVLAGGVAGCIGVVLSSIAAEDVAWLQGVSGLAGIAAGVFIARFTLAWGNVVSSFDMREVLIALCLAFCIQWIPFVAISFLGTVAKVIVAIALPVFSGWCLAGFWGDMASSVQQRRFSRSAEEREAGSPVGRVAGALFCFAFVIQCVWTFNITATVDPLDENLFWLVFACIFAATLVIMALVLFLMNRLRSYRMELFYRIAFVFSIAGSCALGLAHEYLFLSYAVVYVAYALIVSTMWMLSWSVVFMQKEAASRVFGCVFGLQYLAFFLGFAAVKLVQVWTSVEQAAGLLPLFSLAATVILAVAYTAILPERTLLSLSPRLFKLSHESLDARCSDIANHYGLTSREAEIFALLARGRDVGYIEKELFISRNTVNTHRKNLYRKLDIHTQQELLSLIEDTLA